MSVLGDIDYTDDAGKIVPGALAHLTDETPEPPPDVPRCKVPGCEQPSLGMKTGPYAGLCAAHKAERSASRAPRRKLTPAAPKPRATVPPLVRVEKNSTSLTDLARSVDTAAAEVREARGRHERAVAALRAALDAHDE